MKLEKKNNKLWELSEGYGKDFQPDVEKALNVLHARREASTPQAVVRKMPARRKWLQLAAAVAVILVAVWAANMQLDITPTTEMAWETIDVPAAKQHEIVLPDGTLISLHGPATLQYDSKMTSADTRQVRLSGEAFFDVQRNEQQPFVINTTDAQVEVLGTNFNVKTDQEKGTTHVEVTSGKVEVNSMNSSAVAILEAFEGAMVDHTGKLEEYQTKVLYASAWKTRKLEFKNTAVSEVIPVIENVYDIQIDWQTPSSKCLVTFNGNQESLENIFLSLKRLVPNLQIAKQGDRKYQFIGSCD